MSISRTNSHNASTADQVCETQQKGSVNASAHSVNASAHTTSSNITSAHDLTASPRGNSVLPSYSMPSLVEVNPSSSQVSTIGKLRHRMDLFLFGSQVDLLLMFSTCRAGAHPSFVHPMPTHSLSLSLVLFTLAFGYSPCRSRWRPRTTCIYPSWKHPRRKTGRCSYGGNTCVYMCFCLITPVCISSHPSPLLALHTTHYLNWFVSML